MRIRLCWFLVLLAPFLSFMVQPITGKYLLPAHGGSASTWLTALLFFQFSVLAGYGLAAWLMRCSPCTQVGITLSLGVFAAVWTSFPPVLDKAGAGAMPILWKLCLNLLPAMTFVFALGIILHGWLRTWKGNVPWYLYGISNLGSLLALGFYPFWIEGKMPLDTQASIWRTLFVITVLGTALLGKFRWHDPAEATTPKDDPIPARTWWSWLGLSAASCILFMAATRELTSELGSHPLVWSLPLALYLGSFSLVFTGFWKRPLTILSGVICLIAMFYFAHLKGLTITPLSLPGILCLLSTVALGCLLLNGKLYSLRPKENFTRFYLFLALGGALGGVFTTLIAPVIFERNFELYLAFTVCFLVLALEIPRRWITLVSATTLIGVMGWMLHSSLQAEHDQYPQRTSTHSRNLYGHSIYIEEPGRRSVMSETTLHGSQSTHPRARLIPSTYYNVHSPIGVTFKYLHGRTQNRRIGVIGLGIGTLAAYGESGDHMTFWEIDPHSTQLADKHFTYLTDSKAKTDVKLLDGRLGIRQTKDTFDLLVIDAFSGDSIPTHLLTREAFKEFRQASPDGWLAFHISSRWYNIAPVLHQHLKDLDLIGFHMLTRNDPEHVLRHDSRPCLYIIVPPRDAVRDFLGFIQQEVKTNPILAKVTVMPDPNETGILWTDQRHSIIDLMNWELLWKSLRKKTE